ncbi:MAG: putative type restriction enzyme methylase subunit [Verrucomicrobiales bacterium]|nr:putative type restriction enzyme methylase subunit [Verrucomicrobiales bacterium]
MNLSKLKTYAPAARTAFIEAVKRRAVVLGIREDAVEPLTETGDLAVIGGQPFPRSVVPLRRDLLERIGRDGFEPAMEAIAYTWFNRFVALRYMELHGYLSHGYRVLSHPEHGSLPELLEKAEHVTLEGLDRAEVIRLKLDGTRDEELYRLLLLAQCQELYRILPSIFSRLDDATILLLPDNLLHSDSVIRQLVAGSGEEDWQQVEVLGWLYQFYISEKKDAVMARKSAVPTEDIPAVTQLFTPHWIVRYLVENSLGRLWLLNRPGSRLRGHMPYYIEPATAEPPAWQAGWTNRISFREGEFQKWMWLRPQPLPAVPAKEDDDIDDSSQAYALTVDGYAYARSRWGDPDGNKVEELQREGWEYASFEDLRCCLFFLQRAMKWGSGSGPVLEEMKQFRACHTALCLAWQREWSSHTVDLPDLSLVGVEASSAAETDFLKITKPEEIRLVDPAVGSGHMLTYAFDLLTLIYEEEGYAPPDIPGLILRHNLHGLEICPRAAQLAELALVFKARQKSRRFFQPEHLVRPRIIELRDVRFGEDELHDYTHTLRLGDLFNQPVLRLLHQFEEAKTFGSLIQPCFDERAIADLSRAIEAKELGGHLFLRGTHLKVLRVLEQAEALTQRYHVVVANPPYMGAKGMNPKLKTFLQNNFSEYKYDLFAAFLARCLSLSLPFGRMGFMSPFVWMFIASYRDLRILLTGKATITSLVQLEYSGFDGATVPICTFTLLNHNLLDHLGSYIRLSDFRGSEQQGPRTLEAISNPNCGWFYRAAAKTFLKIPGTPIGYFVPNKTIGVFETGENIGSITQSDGQTKTGDNDRFIRKFWEISKALVAPRSWRFHPKGGEYRKWYGNVDSVVNWTESACKHYRSDHVARIIPEYLWEREGFCWNLISSSPLKGFRIKEAGHIFNLAAPTLFADRQTTIALLGVANSKVGNFIVHLFNPTLNCNIGDIQNIPLPQHFSSRSGEFSEIPESCIALARADWDNFETSWDFRDQPLLRPGLKGATLEASWRNWETQSTAAVRRMQELETENNRLFIAAYGLDGELQPEVPEEQITLARAEARRDMAAFLSYAVGCMMGRYSPDHPGLILANAGDSLREFLEKVGKPLAELTFAPDEDGIIPVLDGEWFEDDIVARTRDFLRATFGEAALNGNLQFLKQALGKDLRTYFQNDFGKDHLQTYKNRPIYWLFSSGKQKAFQCLVYLHRYTLGTLARIRTEYVIPLQGKLSARIANLDDGKLKASSSAQSKKFQTEQDQLKKQQAELIQFDEQLRHYADQRIALDLDDGVKVNYAKFGPLVAEAKKVCGAKED